MHFQTKRDLSILHQHTKNMYVMAQILNYDMQIVDSFQGSITEYSYSEDCDSDTRRTISLSVVIKDKTFDVDANAKIWLDKLIRVYVGYEDMRTSEIVYYPKGVYTICDNSFSWDSSTSSLQISCVDQSACCDGTRNGYVRGLTTKIEEGSSIRGALISLITQEAGFKKYRIDTYHRSVPDGYEETIAEFDEIPYDMEFDVNTSIWEKVVEIRDLYPGWEAFFDVDGTFVFQGIPTCEFDEPVITAEQLAPLVQGEPCTITFTEVANVTDLYGQNIEPDRYSDKCTVSGDTYKMTIEDENFDGNNLVLNTKFQVSVSATSVEGQKMSFNNGPSYPIVYEGNIPISAGDMRPETQYIVKYKKGRFYFYGECQVHAICKEVAFTPTAEQIAEDKVYESCNNIKYRVIPDSPFAIKEMWKDEIRRPLAGGEYENIFSNDLASQRADYETWKTTRLMSRLELPIIEIPWLSTNQLIEYTSKRTGETKKYIVKQISTSNGLSTLSCIEFYPLYPFIVQ